MNHRNRTRASRGLLITVTASALLVLAACATPVPPAGLLDNLRAELEALESDRDLAELAPVALGEARRGAPRHGRRPGRG